MNREESFFQKLVLQYFEKNGRHDLPWRMNRTPFNALLSEIMLQQTQVPRVIEKFNLFTSKYNSFEELASAPQSEIVSDWQGLGYNRRSLFLHRSAQQIVSEFEGVLPRSVEQLRTLPGIGPATAASISVYAHNLPIPFIETNVRAVYIHHFFADKNGVSDDELFPIVERTLLLEEPYRWYSALMDYGTMLKVEHKNPARKSVHHVRQSRFHGSTRQIRGKVIRLLVELGQVQKDRLLVFLKDDRSRSAIEDLCEEMMVEEQRGVLFLKR